MKKPRSPGLPRALVLGFLAMASLAPTPTPATDWPAWRGPTADGVTAETDLPLAFGKTENVLWKQSLPGPGNSTPIVWRGLVYLTQAEAKGAKRSLIAFDRKSGKEVWRKTVAFRGKEPTHKTNPFCSASPVTDGERVIVSHGSAGVHCYGLDGKALWQRDLGEFRHIWGNAASPVIWKDLCILNCGPGPRTFLIALDRRTGDTTWKLDIPGGLEGGDRSTWTGSWSDPVIYTHGGRTRILASYPRALLSIEASSGTESWRCEGLGNLVYTSPLWAKDTAVAMSGFMGPAIAVKLGGVGNVTATRRLWRHEKAQQRVGSGTIYEGHIYMVNEPGVAACRELESGKLLWKSRVSGTCWTSLVRSSDRLYTADQSGKVSVFRASPERFEKLAESETGETIRGSIAVSNGQLFIRGYKHLWCIGEKRGESSRAKE